MNRRSFSLSPWLLAGACATPHFAQFPPLPAEVACHRVERERFAVAVPDHWREFGAATPDRLHFVEDAPATGAIRAYRSMTVQPQPPLAGETPEALVAAGLAALRTWLGREHLQELGSGTAELAGRECVFLHGAITPSSYDVVLETWCFLVPGEGASLLLEFRAPQGQLDAARPGFATIAQSLQTSIPPPRTAGELLWFDSGRLGLVLPEGWQRTEPPGATLAEFTLGHRVRCALTTSPAGGGRDLQRLVQDCERDLAAEWPDWRLVAIERGARKNCRFVRLRSAHRESLGTVVVDDVFFVAGDRLDRLQCRAPYADYAAAAANFDRMVGSLRWR